MVMVVGEGGITLFSLAIRREAEESPLWVDICASSYKIRFFHQQTSPKPIRKKQNHKYWGEKKRR